MRKKITVIVVTVFSLIVISATRFPTGNHEPAPEWNEHTPVSEVLKALGDEMPEHYYNGTPEEVRRGRDLLTIGRTTKPSGGRTALQSKHYKCTHCHNMVNEDPDLREPNPDGRLNYAIENNLPYLQGTTLYGVVNRATWYNGDYVSKYGLEAEEAHTSLRKSIHLCATTCSQGKDYNDWEMNAVLAYLWSIELKLGDLKFDDSDWKRLNSEPGESDHDSREARIAWLKSKWYQGSPATFSDQPDNLSAGYGLKGDPERGEAIYRLSCMHCHEPGGITYFILDYERLTFQLMSHNMTRYTMYNMYHVARYGVPSYLGERAYMPNYTLERLSNQQAEDLRSYIEMMALGRSEGAS